VFHQYTLQLKNISRDKVSELLAEKGIPSMIYYPVPSHKQNMLKSFINDQQELPVTDMLTDCVISLPIHTEFTTEELEYISSNFLTIVAQLTNAS
jgi:dTDP-4-amino-4,6-dideoxygalactose transaminase